MVSRLNREKRTKTCENKATRTRLGEPQSYRVPFALKIERKENADLMVTALDLTPRRIPLITFIFSEFSSR